MEEKGVESVMPAKVKEGHNLLGKPKFKKLENGRLKCVQTGHELFPHDTESYAQTKHCRLGLIDYALAKSKPPLNMFECDPFNRSKLICQLTGDTINKTEEHIWKHINGKRFLSMLEKKEAEKEMGEEPTVKEDEVKEEKKKKKKKDKKKKKKMIEDEKSVDEIINEVRDPAENGSDTENELDFWMPPSGERWDHDDGGDRWASDLESESEGDDAGEEGMVTEEADEQTAKLSKKTKRMSIEMEPTSVSSKKKKISAE